MSRIEATKTEARKAAALAEEAKEVLHALQHVMNSAGVSERWCEPEPRGVDAAFATLVISLTSDPNHTREALDMAARDLIDFYLDDEG